MACLLFACRWVVPLICNLEKEEAAIWLMAGMDGVVQATAGLLATLSSSATAAAPQSHNS